MFQYTSQISRVIHILKVANLTTVHSRFSDILFSDKPRFSDNFAEDRFFTT